MAKDFNALDASLFGSDIGNPDDSDAVKRFALYACFKAMLAAAPGREVKIPFDDMSATHGQSVMMSMDKDKVITLALQDFKDAITVYKLGG